MNDLDKIRLRIAKRNGQIKPLNDHNFKSFYNFMIKFMVVIIALLVSFSYLKINPEHNIKEMVLNNQNYQAVTTWISKTLFSFLPSNDIAVNNTITYQLIEDNYFKNDSNEVVSMSAGRVIDTGINDNNESYVSILGNDEVVITYNLIDNVMVTLYDEVEQGMILGSYQDQLELKFEYLTQEISYEEYQRMG